MSINLYLLTNYIYVGMIICYNFNKQARASRCNNWNPCGSAIYEVTLQSSDTLNQSLTCSKKQAKAS